MPLEKFWTTYSTNLKCNKLKKLPFFPFICLPIYCMVVCSKKSAAPRQLLWALLTSTIRLTRENGSRFRYIVIAFIFKCYISVDFLSIKRFHKTFIFTCNERVRVVLSGAVGAPCPELLASSRAGSTSRTAQKDANPLITSKNDNFNEIDLTNWKVYSGSDYITWI